MGIFLYDALTQLTPDEERGIEYEPLTIVEDFDLDIPEDAIQDLTKRTFGSKRQTRNFSYHCVSRIKL